jgi:hypothetical protein
MAGAVDQGPKGTLSFRVGREFVLGPALGGASLNKGWQNPAVVLIAAFGFVLLVYLIALFVIIGGAYRILVIAPVRGLGRYVGQLAPGRGDHLSFRRSAGTPTPPASSNDL